MPARSVAFLVGVDQFSDPKFTPLRFCQNDLDGMARVLGAPEIGGFEIVEERNKRHDEVLASLERTVATLAPGDKLLFYFAGHGRRSQLAGSLYLVAADTKLDALRATGIPIGTALDIIRESRCSNRALVLDCCYSGAVGEAYRGGDTAAGLDNLARNSGTYILTASTAIELAEERESSEIDGKSGNGVFTKYFIEALESGNVPFSDTDQITIDAVYDYIDQHVTTLAAQKPQRFVIGGAGKFVVGRSSAGRWERRRPQLIKKFLKLVEQNVIDDKHYIVAVRIFRTPWSALTVPQKSIGNAALDVLDGKISVTEFCTRLNGREPEAKTEVLDTPTQPPAHAAPPVQEQPQPRETQARALIKTVVSGLRRPTKRAKREQQAGEARKLEERKRGETEATALIKAVVSRLRRPTS